MRKLITLVLMGAAFYGGLQVERVLSEGRCQAGGGTYLGGLCRGIAP
ncbi:hypothetical protein C8N43_3245 [Litoreibacter ponti]|uniref:Uncharacterized protein n=1 Tax=Litoreibacter ponti TaxID=1510457 RepID=A0A2T6BEE1_9RHOB|nr:hypothetical protein [Litoreibacter ponti]PTX54430.1 hypothetical protein C8N43_3245 [Litoreibacter ponti]